MPADYTLTLTADDLATISRACEHYARTVGMGQVGEIVTAWALRSDRRGVRLMSDPAAWDEARDLAVRLQGLLTGLAPHSYIGIAEAQYPQARRAYALHILLRYHLAWDRLRAEGRERPGLLTVDYDEPESLGTGPLPTLRPVGPATAPQPAPADRGVPVWPTVIADLEARERDEPGRGYGQLARDGEVRDAFGRAKYGLPLMSEDGRGPYADAYQEALDLMVYLRRLAMRRKGVWWRIYGLAVDLARQIVEEGR